MDSHLSIKLECNGVFEWFFLRMISFDLRLMKCWEGWNGFLGDVLPGGGGFQRTLKCLGGDGFSFRTLLWIRILLMAF